MKGTNILWFIGGAATGSLIVWQLLKKKYQKIADAEIESVKKAYENKKPVTVVEQNEIAKFEKPVDIPIPKHTEKERELAHSSMNKPDILEYKNRVTEYTTPPMVPYRITEEQYGDCDYECISITYYADDVVADDGDYVIDDVDGILGEENIADLAAKREDLVWIRNDVRRVDYEVAYSEQLYSDVTK